MKQIIKRTGAFLLALLMLSAGLLYGYAAKPAAGDVDLDGNVTSADARLALRASVKLERLAAEEAVNADADRSGDVTAADARLILRRSVGLETLEPFTEDAIRSVPLTEDERKPYESDAYELVYLASVTAGGTEHIVLDDYLTIDIPTEEGATEEDLLNMVGVTFNDAGEPFFLLPDAEARAQGKLRFDTLHLSLFGAAKLTDEQLLDQWAERAAAHSATRRISEDEITPGIAEMLTDCGLADDQYAGAVVRSILSLDTKGEILTAAADGNTEALRTKVISFAGEYYLGKLFKQEEDQFLTQSLGDHADSVKKAVKDGKYKEALTDIVKNIEKNVFPAVNYADKIASITDKLADIWTDDMMNQQYEAFKKLGGAGISDDDWNLVYMQLRGAANRLSSKGVSAADLRRKFEQRAKNEEKIAAAKKELLKDAAQWRDMGLMNTVYWYNSLGEYPSDIERLNSLRQIRETIRRLLTLNGKFQRGKDYMTDKDFLTDALFEWVTNGVKGRANFYKWLREKGVYLPREETNPPEDPNNLPFAATPVKYSGGQDYEFMEDAEAMLLSAGAVIFYKNGSGRRFDITVEDAELGNGVTVSGMHLTGSYKYGSWDDQTGSCSFHWNQPFTTVDYEVAVGGGKTEKLDPVTVSRIADHIFSASSLGVVDNGAQIILTFYGTDTANVYEYHGEKPDLCPGYPTTRKCSFTVTFTY